MKHLVKKNLFFLFPYFIFLVAGIALIYISGKDKLHLHINTYHNSLADLFFDYLTYLGDGWMALAIAIALLFFRYRYSLIIILSYLLSSTIVQTLKHFVFYDSVRPALFFKNNPDLYLVPGVDNNIFNSFPSGHTATAFAIYFCLSLFVSNNVLKLCLFLLALLIGYSRVYLSQHFFEDIYAGSLIGVCSTIIVYALFFKEKVNSKLDRSLVNRN